MMAFQNGNDNLNDWFNNFESKRLAHTFIIFAQIITSKVWANKIKAQRVKVQASNWSKDKVKCLTKWHQNMCIQSFLLKYNQIEQTFLFIQRSWWVIDCAVIGMQIIRNYMYTFEFLGVKIKISFQVEKVIFLKRLLLDLPLLFNHFFFMILLTLWFSTINDQFKECNDDGRRKEVELK